MRPAETGAHEKTYMMLEYAMIRLERKMDLFYPFPTMREWNETCRKMLVDALKDALMILEQTCPAAAQQAVWKKDLPHQGPYT